MKMHGVKREWSHPIFCMKKHYCPHCNEMLEKTKTETIVNSKSEEAKNYDFSQPGGDGYMMGNITDAALAGTSLKISDRSFLILFLRIPQ